MSQCGTFAVVGSAGGSIDMFNMQSGLHRQSFPPRLPKAHGTKVRPRANTASFARDARHTKAVTGLMIDNLNRTVLSCGLDGKVKVSYWFHSLHRGPRLDTYFILSSGTCFRALCSTSWIGIQRRPLLGFVTAKPVNWSPSAVTISQSV